MLRHANRPHAGSTTSVGNGKGFVQVQVANIGPDVTRTREPNLCVHVSAVHVNLAAVLVNDPGDFGNRLLKHAMG